MLAIKGESRNAVLRKVTSGCALLSNKLLFDKVVKLPDPSHAKKIVPSFFFFLERGGAGGLQGEKRGFYAMCNADSDPVVLISR